MDKLLAESLIRDVPDFPIPGIVFKDITPVVQDAAALKQVIDVLAEWGKGLNPDLVMGIEARGFIFRNRPCARAQCRLCAPAQIGQTARRAGHGRVRAGVRHEYGRNARRRHQARTAYSGD